MKQDGPNRLLVGLVLGTVLGFVLAIGLGISKASSHWRVKAADRKTEIAEASTQGEVGTYESRVMFNDRVIVVTDTRSGEVTAYLFHFVGAGAPRFDVVPVP